ncbi:MAG TPA: pitrilysin family protein [Candidatus Acidoferrales bacterium]|nr:pitrilysin family protein [Candidatus Acidoferrales bacterium]
MLFKVPALFAMVALAAAALAARSPGTEPRVEFQQFTLANGLRVILSEDHSAPTYSICVTYNVGSRDERPGRTGLAHLFEHMMFQGSENVGKGEHFILVSTHGGRANGTTNAERTNYFETLPANQLELGIFLEADRMRALEITQANLDNQRHAVQEERRLRYDNRPYGKTAEAVLATAYDNFAYRHSVIGSMEDLNAATLEDARAFFRTYYAPNNAVLSLVGDFRTEQALALIKKYFAPIPSQPPPPVPDLTEPEQTSERRRTVEDAFAQAPGLDIVFKTVPGHTADWYALRVLGHILAGDLSSRLYQKLIKDLELAVSVSSGPEERRGRSLFWISLIVKPGKDLARVEQLVYEELERLKNDPVADWELDKVRIKFRRQQAETLYSTRARANALGHYAVYYNQPELINTALDKVLAVTKADLQRVARAYLTAANRTVVTTLPESLARAAQP